MDVKGGLAHVLDQLEREKGVKKEDIITMIEQAMVSAYRKHAGEGLKVEATIEETGEISACIVKTIVEEVEDDETEISIEEAQEIDENAQIGGEVRYPIDTQEFGRIAAQTAKQVLTQKIRETERENVFTEYKPKEGTLINGAVHRFVNRNVIVDLGRAEAILPFREQVRREHWRVGERIRALLVKVDKGLKGPELILSRASEEFVMKLFEQEVPEIYEKTVKVVKVVREPGSRSKVVVQSFNSKVDPIGACVGVKGSRVRPIINEMQGERIDLVAYSEDIATFIASSLTPAKPISVTLTDPQNKKAEVLVPDDAYSLAIGKNGQNVRLASKLTGWQIDLQTEAQKRKTTEDNALAAREMFLELEGAGPRTAEVLIKGGMDSLDKIARCKPEDLTVYSGIGEKVAEKLIDSAKISLEKKKEEAENPKPEDVADQAESKEAAEPETAAPAAAVEATEEVASNGKEDAPAEAAQTEKAPEPESDAKKETTEK